MKARGYNYTDCREFRRPYAKCLAYVNGSQPIYLLPRRHSRGKKPRINIEILKDDFSGLAVICSSPELWITAVDSLLPPPFFHHREIGVMSQVFSERCKSSKNFARRIYEIHLHGSPINKCRWSVRFVRAPRYYAVCQIT